MQKSFKKVLSILLAVMLLVSVFPAMFSVNAVEPTAPTALELGAASMAGGMTVAEAPDGTYALKSYANDDNLQVVVAKDGEEFVPVVGNDYTISFKYYLPSTDTAHTGRFYLQHGNAVYYNGEPDGRKEIAGTSYTVSQTELDQWVQVHIPFTEAETFSKNNAEVRLENIVLTSYHGGAGVARNTTYVKDIQVHNGKMPAATPVDAVDKTLSVKTYYTDNGNGTITSTAGGGDSDNYAYAYGTENDLIVYGSASHGEVATLQGTATKKGWNKSLQIEGFELTAGATYKAIVPYKLVSKGDGTWVTLGVASSALGTTEGYYYGGKSLTVGDWDTLEVTFVAGPSAPGSTKLTVTYKGDFELHLKDVQLVAEEQDAYIGDPTGDAVRIIANDNGEKKIAYAWKGDALPEIALNEKNAAMGQKRIAWCTDAHLTAAVTTVPTDMGNEINLYAKYPTTIIDFNYRKAYTSAYGVSDQKGMSMSVNNLLGQATVKYSANVGFMFPNYDADISDQNSTNNAYYIFTPGVKYKLEFVIDSNDIAFEMAFPSATHSGSQGSRYTGNEGTHGSFKVPVTDKKTTYTHVLTFTPATVNTMANRIFSTSTVVYDAIMITPLTDESYNNGLSISYSLDNDGDVDTYPIAAGEVQELPAPTKAGYIFAGWRNINATANGKITENDIPVHVLKGDASIDGATYKAIWVSTETRRTEFNESSYVGLGGGGTKSGSYTINTDTGVASFSNASPNDYKVSLFDAAGSRYYLYDGVTYRITIRYKRIEAGSDSTIGVTRNNANSYGPMLLTKAGSGTSVVTNDNEISADWVTKTQDFTVFGTYVANDGSDESLASAVRSELSLSIRSGKVDVDYVEVTPIGFVPVYKTIENAEVSVDYANQTVTITPDAGYDLEIGSVSTEMMYRDWSTYKDAAEELQVDAIYNDLVPVFEGTDETDGYTFKFDFGSYTGARISAMMFRANIIPESDATINADFVAYSLREKSGVYGTSSYDSAGIRFKLRLANSTLANIDKLEFAAVPQSVLGDGKFSDYIEANGSEIKSAVAYTKDQSTNNVYGATGTDFVNYQCVVTGLTGAADKTETQICFAAIITIGEQTTVIETPAFSYVDLQ